jgi:hypothetical protein
VLSDIDGDDLDTAINAWINTTTTNTPTAIAVDGKSLRGTFARTGGAGIHLLSALTQPGRNCAGPAASHRRDQ